MVNLANLVYGKCLGFHQDYVLYMVKLALCDLFPAKFLFKMPSPMLKFPSMNVVYSLLKKRPIGL
jgi:hypothetical protein